MRLTLSAVLMLGVLVLQPSAAAQDVARTDEHYVVQFDQESGEALSDFIAVSRGILERPIRFSPEEVDGVRIHVVDPVIVPRDDYPLFFQAVLRAYDFLVVAAGPVGATSLSIRRISHELARPGRPGGCQAPTVPVDSLHLYADDRSTLITTHISLTLIDAHTAARILAATPNVHTEQVRSAGRHDSLVITGFAQDVWRAYRLVGRQDVPPLIARPTPNDETR